MGARPDDDDDRFTTVERVAWLAGARGPIEADLVAREEPLEIRINQTPIAVVMRTPGDDEALVRGFLLSERIVASPEQIVALRHCTSVDRPEAEDNVMLVRLRDDADVDLAALRRNLFASSSCGVCGKASIEQALALPELRRAVDGFVIDALTLARWPEQLRAAQEVFEHTGGLHGAGLFTAEGELLAAFEDVGRHNAVDKLIGWAAREGVALDECGLMVSGRVSFEITQKAVAVGIPLIAAVSAPTSLAVELARAAGITLVCFVREQRMCVYAGEQRIKPLKPPASP
ncbi:MAG TPA: formate dehydrogenase accessory sulfurtransferase FdhD [Enhygromyxa sp.]|nr:formate dehydrogenase accessory sulfurtransferase FdhD [Enhygromyxa sp.]